MDVDICIKLKYKEYKKIGSSDGYTAIQTVDFEIDSEKLFYQYIFFSRKLKLLFLPLKKENSNINKLIIIDYINKVYYICEENENKFYRIDYKPEKIIFATNDLIISFALYMPVKIYKKIKYTNNLLPQEYYSVSNSDSSEENYRNRIVEFKCASNSISCFSIPEKKPLKF